jgi:hypothetical protein
VEEVVGHGFVPVADFGLEQAVVGSVRHEKAEMEVGRNLAVL